MELFQPGEWPEFEILAGEVDLLEELMELPGTLGHVPVAGEARQVPRQLVETHPVAAVVSALGAERRRATGKAFRDEF